MEKGPPSGRPGWSAAAAILDPLLNPISLITDPTSLCPILMISDSVPMDLISLILDPATLDPI